MAGGGLADRARQRSETPGVHGPARLVRPGWRSAGRRTAKWGSADEPIKAEIRHDVLFAR
jgi:hypothetical protein